MKTARWRVRQAMWYFQCVYIAVGTFQTCNLALLHAADAPIDQTKPLGVHPHRKSPIMKTASNAFAAFRDGTKVICADDNVAELWDTTTGHKLLSLKHSEVVIGVAIAPDEKTLLTITAGRENPVHLWNLENGKTLQEYPSPFRNSVVNATAEKNNTSGWDIHNSVSWDFFHRDYAPRTGFGFTSVAFSPTGQEFATGSENGVVIVWNTTTGKEISRMVGKVERIWSVVFSPDCTRLFTLSCSGMVAIWDTKTNALVKQFKESEGQEHLYTSLLFSSDSKQFIFYGSNHQAICDIRTGKKVQCLPKAISVDKCITLLSGENKLHSKDGYLLDIYYITRGKVVNHHARFPCVAFRYAHSNVICAEYLPDISAIMTVEVEDDENTMHEDWTTISIVPLAEFHQTQ